MGDDKAVQRLIEKLSAFYTEERPVEEDLTYSLTSEFLRNIRRVLFTKQLVSLYKWGDVFNVSCFKMLSTPEMYLTYVIYACRQYAHLYLNIFERFLAVFALLLHLRVVTFDRPALNFSKLLPDIFMAFYDSELKKSFGRCGGFYRFVEYINNPKYLALNCIKKDVADDFNKQLNRILCQEKDLPKDFRLEEAEIDRPSITLAQKILKSSKSELPSFPNDADVMTKLRDFPQQMREQLAEEKRIFESKLRTLEAVLEECLNSDSATNDVVAQVTDDAQYENIIQAVTRYNRSNSSGQANQNNPLQKEACGILEHLKDKIKYFIEFLDEYDQE